jgi:hypothetical protein
MDLFMSSGEGWETSNLLGLTGPVIEVSTKGPNRVSPSFHLKTETYPASETLCFFSYLEFRTMDKINNFCDSECFTSSSEPFIFY